MLASMYSKQPLLEEIQTVDHNSYWISLVYNRHYTVSLFYTNGIKSNIYVKKEAGWVEIELKEEEKKGIDEFIDRRKDGGVRYKRVRRVSILGFEQLTGDKMIEYDMNGDIIYEGRCEGDMGNGFYRSGYGCEYRNRETVYIGNWVLNKRQGQGKCYVNGKVYYDGNWQDDLPHGYGKSYVNDKVYYEGNWRDGLPHGYGKMADDQGQIIKGNWQDGCLQIGNKIYYYESIEDDWVEIPNSQWICSIAFVGLFYLFTGPNFNQLISPQENFYFYFVIFGGYCLIIALFTQIVTWFIVELMKVCVYCSSVWMICYGFQIIDNWNSFFFIFYLIAFYPQVVSIYLFVAVASNPPSKDNVFYIIVRKKAFYCIFIELIIGGLLTTLYYWCFWYYKNYSGDHSTDLRNYGTIILFDGFVYICIAVLHCCQGILFILGNWIGFIWGIVSFLIFGWFCLDINSIWETTICPSNPTYYTLCDTLRVMFKYITLFTWVCSLTSFTMHRKNRK